MKRLSEKNIIYFYLPYAHNYIETYIQREIQKKMREWWENTERQEFVLFAI